MNIKVFRRAVLSCSVVVLGCLLQACPQPIAISDGYFSAIVRTDGKIQTNFSTDGLTWGDGHIHTDAGTVDKGVGLAADKTGTQLFLCFFGSNQQGNDNRLFVRYGLGNTWQSHLPTQISTSAASAPSICRIDNRYYFIAWKNGSGSISTALLDGNSMGSQNAFRLLGDINDNLASKIEGGPSVSAMGNKILMVWRTRTSNGGHDYASNLMTFAPSSANISIGNSSQLSPPAPPSGLDGFPQVTDNETNFFLSVGVDYPTGNGVTHEAYKYSMSTDGTTWTAFSCPENENVLDVEVRPHAFTIDRNSRITELVTGSGGTGAQGGLLARACDQRKNWDDNLVFDNGGKIGCQPAVIFRKGNQ